MTLSMQVTSCQREFVIELLEFENPRNLEIMEVSDNLLLCCCDDNSICVSNSSDVVLNDCDDQCDTFVTVTLDDCEPTEECTISTIQGIIDNGPPVPPFGYILSFHPEKIPDEVIHLLCLS